jgi:predicted ATP-dependent Lon-type protease
LAEDDAGGRLAVLPTLEEDGLDCKAMGLLGGKVVRKDLTSLMRRGANVPTFVLEYLLGMYCSTDDEELVAQGVSRIRRILAENYVRPDESEAIKSRVRELGQYTIIDRVSARLDEFEDAYITTFASLSVTASRCPMSTFVTIPRSSRAACGASCASSTRGRVRRPTTR